MSQSDQERWQKGEDHEGEDEISSLCSSHHGVAAKQSLRHDMKDEPHMIAQRDNAPPPPPNGGYGWVCTVCVGLINAHTWGLNSSYGVFLAHYLATNAFPGASSLEFAFVGSLSISCAMLVSPLATISCRELGLKPTLAVGIVLETASFIAASFASKIWHLFLSQGICFGFGMGFLFVASVGVVPQWFTTRRSLANGFSTAGSGLGGLVYSLAAGAMIRNIGLPWAFRILGILCFVVNSICTVLIKDRNKIIGSNQLAFDSDLFTRIEYNLLLLFGFFSMLGYVVLIFSLANYANEIGLNASQASIVSAIFNLGQGLGRPLIGYFSDNVGRINMAAGMTFLCGVFSFAIWIPASSYGVLLFFAVIGGMVAGTFWCTIAPVTAEVVGLKDVPSGLNIIWLDLVLPCTFSEPIALEIVDGTGRYLGAQLFVGFMYIAAAMCLFVLRGWKIGELDEIALAKAQRPEDLDSVKVECSDAVSVRSRKVGRRKMLAECWKWRKV
ncbi:MFS general substrate transporter [Polychaeton citri CBS 116435]|uniref:MFS general substrate transporter n=1 Tax=Polychaeton citri CBS 116435 TaxID=1314669 RepID=A0A9P4QDE3_9PEZI|nr:MFS general substrate transporter [Polychaeton citri CBS 116435]